MLKETFTALCEEYTNDQEVINELWKEIEDSYTGRERYYHTLQHLENLLKQLGAIKSELQDWQAVLFSLYYHDIIYDVLKTDNEVKSAEAALTRMKQIDVPEDIMESCKDQIIATKAHTRSADPDTNYFTDADLSILGQGWDIYKQYSKDVRKEYAIYPDAIYIPGRKNVLNHFLSMERIFKTDLFHERFEIQAKQNLRKELESL